MMNKLILPVLALMALSVPAGAANVLTNGDFSQGTAGWTVWSATQFNDDTGNYRTPTCFFANAGNGVVGLGGATNLGYNGVLYQSFDVAPSSTYTVSGNIFTTDNSQKRFCEIVVLNSDAGWVNPSRGDFSITAGGANNHYGTWGPANNSGGYDGAWTGSTAIICLSKISYSGTTPQIPPWQHTDLSPLTFAECIRWSNTPDMTFTTGASQSRATLLFHVGSYLQGTPWQCDIRLDNIQVSGPAALPRHVYGVSNRAAHEIIAITASAKSDFKVWGKVAILDSNSFTIDDGTGAPVDVVAPGYSGIQNNDFACAVGPLAAGGGMVVMSTEASKVAKLN